MFISYAAVNLVYGPPDAAAANAAANRAEDAADAALSVLPPVTFATVAALRASTGVVAGAINLLGYHAAGDSGGGSLYLDAADTTTADNGGTVFHTADSPPKRIKRTWSGNIQAAWFGAKPEIGFDNGPAIRAAYAAAKAAGNSNAAVPVELGAGVFELRSQVSATDAPGGVAGIWFDRSETGLIGQGMFLTELKWYTATAGANAVFFNVGDGSGVVWNVVCRDMKITCLNGAANGSAVLVKPSAPGASLGYLIQNVRVVGCLKGIGTENGGGLVTAYGGRVDTCSVEGVLSGGEGFYGDAAYAEWVNCEAYPAYPDGAVNSTTVTTSPGRTALTFNLSASHCVISNCRGGGPARFDCPDGIVHFTQEGTGSDHPSGFNGACAVQIFRCGVADISLNGVKLSGASGPDYGLRLRDDNTVLRRFVQINGDFSSPTTPLLVEGSGHSLLAARMSGAGVKPESDVNTGLDPTHGGRLRIVNGGTYTDFGKWTATYDPPSIAAGANVTTTVACPGARPGLPVVAGLTTLDAGVAIDAQITGGNVATVKLTNTTGGAIDMASGTLRVSPV